jgi:hypothetical protein
LRTWSIDRLRQTEIDHFAVILPSSFRRTKRLLGSMSAVNEVLFVYRSQTGDYLRCNFQS